MAEIPLGKVVTGDMVTKQTISIAGKDRTPSLTFPRRSARRRARPSRPAPRSTPRTSGSPNITQLDVPAGKRAIDHPTNELTGVGNLVKVGDNVDVLITLGAAAFPVVQVLRDGTITVVTGLNATSVKLPLLLENVQILGTIDQAVAAPAQGQPAASRVHRPSVARASS